MAQGGSTLLRREEVLAYIIERIVRSGAAPSDREIAAHMQLSKTRIRELIGELAGLGIVERAPGSARGLIVRDVEHSRRILVAALNRLGIPAAIPLGALEPPCPHGHLPALPAIEHVSLDAIRVPGES